MAINQNHQFEDLDGIKCAVVEKNATQQRIDFLKPLLELNGFKVVVVGSPPPKSATPDEAAAVTTPSTFTIGVTDVTFNATNAIFGRLLKTDDGKIVSLAYWKQAEKVSDNTVPYYEK
jgi:hypothetical protein